ncbi:MAG: cell division protein FtsQ/DivIB [Fusobacteriaceae bacterium]
MKLFLGSLFILISLFSIYDIENSFLHKDVFKIQELKISGEFTTLKNEVLKFGNELYMKNIWEIDKDKIEKTLKEDIRVEKVNVDFKNLSEISIYIEEKKAHYYVNLEEKIYMIDKKGEIFALLNETQLKNIPIIYIKNFDEIQKAIELLKKIKDDKFLEMVSQVYIESDQEINLLIDGKTIVKTNLEVVENKYLRVRELFIELSKDQKIEYIDLRFDGFVVKEQGRENVE